MLKRKREGKTDYKKRLALLKSGKTRLVVRKTNRNIIAQAVNYDKNGDKVIKGVNSRELIKYNWNISRKNIPAAYLSGYLLGKKIRKNIKEMILDIGLYDANSNSVLYSVAKGVLDAGVNVKIGEKKFPRDERINGEHIKEGLGKKFETVKKAIEDEREK